MYAIPVSDITLGPKKPLVTHPLGSLHYLTCALWPTRPPPPHTGVTRKGCLRKKHSCGFIFQNWSIKTKHLHYLNSLKPCNIQITSI